MIPLMTKKVNLPCECFVTLAAFKFLFTNMCFSMYIQVTFMYELSYTGHHSGPLAQVRPLGLMPGTTCMQPYHILRYVYKISTFVHTITIHRLTTFCTQDTGTKSPVHCPPLAQVMAAALHYSKPYHSYVYKISPFVHKYYSQINHIPYTSLTIF